ncbi:hypothetical protein [Streptomyces sp. XH2]|uniref:hypothetical protein n=1 Tax=Streptomyces sp. XH2 TaxID=3412483 RepID=UPI003C7D57AE
MNRNAMRISAATIIAAVAVGVAGTAADAATSTPEAPRAGAAALSERAAAQLLAGNLLKYEGSRFNAQDKAELQAIASGEFAETRGALGALVKALKKVKGFSGAVAKSYGEFKKWADGLPWYIKGPLAAAGLYSNLNDVWQLFH